MECYLLKKQSEINLIIESHKFIFHYSFGSHFHVGFCLDSYIGSPFTSSTTETDIFQQTWQGYVLFAVVNHIWWGLFWWLFEKYLPLFMLLYSAFPWFLSDIALTSVGSYYFNVTWWHGLLDFTLGFLNKAKILFILKVSFKWKLKHICKSSV